MKYEPSDNVSVRAGDTLGFTSRLCCSAPFTLSSRKSSARYDDASRAWYGPVTSARGASGESSCRRYTVSVSGFANSCFRYAIRRPSGLHAGAPMKRPFSTTSKVPVARS